MSRNDLTAERLREALSYNPETGEFVWLIDTSRRKGRVGAKAGDSKEGRWRIGLDGNRYFSHRLAWFYVHGEWPKHQIDHIDGNPLNNELANLRDVPGDLNSQNKSRPTAVKRGPKLIGVHLARYGTFRAVIKTKGRAISLGNFKTAEAASAAYWRAKAELHPGSLQVPPTA